MTEIDRIISDTWANVVTPVGRETHPDSVILSLATQVHLARKALDSERQQRDALVAALNSALDAINGCLDTANGREDEWGDRAKRAFSCLWKFDQKAALAALQSPAPETK